MFVGKLNPETVALILAGLQRPWWIAGGWAIERFAERHIREHRDVDVAILREDQDELREYLHGWRLEKIVVRAGGSMREPWEGQGLELPVYQVFASLEGNELEFLLNETRGDDWVFRRDPRVAMPLSRAGTTSATGQPLLNPAIVLLYKAKNTRRVDEQDFGSALPRLSDEDRTWLRDSLVVCHPKHNWLRRLDG